MSDFMQKQVTGKQNWIRVETTCGTEFIPGDLAFVRNSDCPSMPLTVKEHARYEGMIRPYIEGTIESWENISGFGARLSAPGYLDCTEWTVFDTEDEAREYLEETYPDDEE
jgi:hypothetical protein